jgi:hypothetical protein
MVHVRERSTQSKEEAMIKDININTEWDFYEWYSEGSTLDLLMRVAIRDDGSIYYGPVERRDYCDLTVGYAHSKEGFVQLLEEAVAMGGE